MFEIGVENQLYCGAALLAGGAVALAVGGWRAARNGIKPQAIALATALLPLLAAFFSHLLFCLVDLENTLYSQSVWYFITFWKGGYMLYGGLAGAALALLLTGGSRKAVMLESYAPSIALMIAAARIAEGFMGQGYGEYWYGDPALCRFPLMMYDAQYEEWAWALFMLEAAVALALFAALLIKKRTWAGDGALLLLGLFASAQIVLESLRRDEYLRWGFVRVEELMSAVGVLAALIGYCAKTGVGRRLQKALCFCLYAAMITLCLLLEFATEGRIPFLAFLDVNACYITMAGACAALGGSVLLMRHICGAGLAAKGKDATA